MVIVIIFLSLAAICKAIQDTILFHWYASIFSKIKHGTKLFNWLNPEFSWQNKWKEGDRQLGEKFWGSSRWFTPLTDGWHLLGLLRSISFICMLTFFEYYTPFINRICDTFILFIIFSVIFEILFVLAEKINKT